MSLRIAALCLGLSCLSLGQAAAAGVPAERVVNAFSDASLIDGFMDTVFGAETFRRNRQDLDTITHVKKFIDGVRVHIINRSEVDRTRNLRDFIRLLDASVQNLHIDTVADADSANMIVFLTDRADYRRVIRETLPAEFDTGFLEQNACSAVTGGRRETGLERAFVYIVANEGISNFRHCMIEEVTQSLGPVNDNVNLPHSIYNDESEIAGFGVFDWFILNMLYDERVRTGMSRDEVRRVLPAAIRDARRRLPGVLRSRRLERPRATR